MLNYHTQKQFDADKSQASMPRLYEHIDRVDLWIMAQKQYHERELVPVLAIGVEGQRKINEQAWEKNKRLKVACQGLYAALRLGEHVDQNEALKFAEEVLELKPSRPTETAGGEK